MNRTCAVGIAKDGDPKKVSRLCGCPASTIIVLPDGAEIPACDECSAIVRKNLGIKPAR